MQVIYTKTVSGPDASVCGNVGERRELALDVAKSLRSAGAVQFLCAGGAIEQATEAKPEQATEAKPERARAPKAKNERR